MKTFAIYNTSTGQIRQIAKTVDREAIAPMLVEGFDAVELEAEIDNSKFYFDGTALQSMPEKPSADHKWNWESKEWHDPRSLQELKDIKWREIKALRNKDELGEFPYMGKLLQGDRLSVLRIERAVVRANAAKGTFKTLWRAADNTELELDAEAMKRIPLAIAEYSESLKQKADELRKEIDEAKTPAALHAIKW